MYKRNNLLRMNIMEEIFEVSIFCQTISKSAQFRSTCSTDNKKLHQTPASPRFGDRAFSVAGPVVWNSLPAAVREAHSLHSFRRKLKTHLFTLCFND